MKITNNDIARMAGVSRGAVDKTIHNRPGVREEIRQHIRSVMQETGYIPLAERKTVSIAIKPVDIAVILPRLTNPYFAALCRHLQHTCLMMPGTRLAFFFCDTTDTRALLAAIQQVSEQPFDGMLFRGVSNDAVQGALESFARPVIFFDSDMPVSNRLCFVGEDCINSGRIAASLLTKSISRPGQVAVITGSEHIPSHRQRLQGFVDTIRSNYSDIQIIDPIFTQEQPAAAYYLAARLLEDHPQIAGVCNLAGCSGEIGQAILEHRTNSTIPLVCFNTADDVAELIHKGIVTFSINLKPSIQARQMLETMAAFVRHGSRPGDPFLKVPVSIIIEENVNDLTIDFASG